MTAMLDTAALRVAFLAQEIGMDSNDTVFDVVAAGLPGLGQLISDYHHTANELEHCR